MENKMRKQETAEAMGRGRDTLTRRNFSKRRQRGGFAKKGMAYFCSFSAKLINIFFLSHFSQKKSPFGRILILAKRRFIVFETSSQ